MGCGFAGADEAYDYHTPDFLKTISEAYNGIDVILEMAADANLANDMAALAKGKSSRVQVSLDGEYRCMF